MSVPWYLMAKGKGGGGYKTASGPIVSINDALASPLRSLRVGIDPVQDLHGYDSPWPAGGGKNKFNVDTIGNSTYITVSNGVITVSGNGRNPSKKLSDLADLVVGETYVLTASTTGAANYIYLTTSAESWYFGQSRTISQNDLDSNVLFYAGGADVTANISAMMIRLSSVSDASFSPYSNLCPISGWTEANVWRTGNNVWDEEIANGYWNHSNNGVFVADSRFVACKNKISVLPDTTYFWRCPTVGREILYYDGNSNLISYASVTAAANTFTTPSNCVFVAFYMGQAYGTTYNHDISINYPSTDHDYHAYQGTTATIQLGQTVYGGTLDVLSGVLTVDRAMFTPTIGTNAITDMSTATDRITRVSYTLSNYNLPDAPTANVTEQSLGRYSHGVYNGTNSGWSSKNYHGYAASLRAHIFVDCDPTSADVTAYLAAQVTAGTPVQLVYPLATPITIPLTPQEISTLAGQNVMWADCGEVDVEYLSAGGANPDLMKLAVAFMGKK